MFKGSRVLITGGTGTLGRELVKQLEAFECKDITVYSRNEVSQVEMKRLYPFVNYVIGDVRDRKVIKRVCRHADFVFHLAAIKHVCTCEKQPMEAVKTNIQGTQNMADACRGQLISMSTDKAVNPTSVYGYTKAIAEGIVLAAGGINIRSGNIFASSGSVVPLFIAQARRGQTITLTNGLMTRFFIMKEELVKFMLQTTQQRLNGTFWPNDLKAYTMRDIAETIVSLLNSKSKIVESGACGGEKLHESLDGTHYSNEFVSPATELFVKDAMI
jgi:UDP-N-acetylglucosamine 4,6-dehydratase/5-epimerase